MVSEAEAGKTSSHHFSPSMCMDHALGHAKKWGQSQPEVLAGRNTPHILHEVVPRKIQHRLHIAHHPIQVGLVHHVELILDLLPPEAHFLALVT